MIRYKINLQKSRAFLTINAQKKIKEMIPLTTATRKCLGMNVVKEVIDRYTENLKTSVKKLNKSRINGKISCAHGSEELILLKCPYNPKQSTYSTLSQSKLHFLIEKKILKFV